MKIKELREKSLVELRQLELLYAEELFNLRMQSVAKQLEKPSRVRDLRRGVARVKTLLRAEEIKDPAAYASAAATAIPKKTIEKKAEVKEVKKEKKSK